MGNLLVTGAGGMIGGHLVWDLLDNGHHVLAVDVKPLGEWWQAERWVTHPAAPDLLVCGRYDLSDPRQARKAVNHAVRRHDDPLWIYHLAADMGGIGFIEENRAACARSVVMNVAVLDAAAAHGDRIGRLFYSSSACFTAGAPVLTRDGVRPIEEIREGDEVLTHRGRWRRVTGTTANPYLGPLVQVRPVGRPAVTCTADHRLLNSHGEWVEAQVATEVVSAVAPGGGEPDVTAVAVTAPVDGAAMVYNLHVEEDHSYVVNGFAVHNCVYPAGLQRDAEVTALAEDDAYPAEPEAGYGEEKLFTESLMRYYREDFGVPTRVARYHNIYGPWGTWTGGREKAPAAVCRKVAEAVLSGRHEIEVWGDGEQTRSFCWVGDCVEGTRRLAASDVEVPVNIGSDELVTINELIDVVEAVAGVRLGRHYLLDAPKGVRGRNSDNTRCRSVLGWAPGTSLADGMEVLYGWVYDQVAAAVG